MRIYKFLIVLLSLTMLSLNGHCQCKKFSAEAKVVHTSVDNDRGSIEIEVKGISKDQLTLNLFGPRRKNRVGLSDFLVSDLEKGHYLIVVSAKDERNEICPVSINVTIN